MNERGQRSKYDQAPVSLFEPPNDALGGIWCISFNTDGVLVRCQIVKPDYIAGIRWLMEHCK